jgi:hypothetical protein
MFFSRQLEGVWSQPGSQEQLQMVYHLQNFLNNVAEIETVNGDQEITLLSEVGFTTSCSGSSHSLLKCRFSVFKISLVYILMAVANQVVQLSIIPVLYAVFIVMPFSCLLIAFAY